MPREFRASLEDILISIRKIRKYISGISNADELFRNEQAYDAVIRNLEIIGEAVKNILQNYRSRIDNVDWRGIAGLRDVLIHQYFGISGSIIWDIVTRELAILEDQVIKLLEV